MFVRMLKLPPEVRERYDVSSMQVAVHAAAPCPVDVKRAMIDWWGPVICEYYAATEAVGITFIDSAQWLEHPGSVGRAGLGEVRIADPETGELLPAGRVGTVYFERHDGAAVHLPQRPREDARLAPSGARRLGHHRRPGLPRRRRVALPHRPQGIHDHFRRGEHLPPRDAEDALALHPAVLDVAVIGVPDAEMGEAVLAVVQPAPDAEPGPELERELIAHTRDRTSPRSRPRGAWCSPTTCRARPTGKLVKQKLRERYPVARASASSGGRSMP